jgi:hypothetical protein
MDRTFNPREGVSIGYGEKAEYTNGELFGRETEAFTYVDCQMTLHIQDDPKVPWPGEMIRSSFFSFSLHDIDPTSFDISIFDSKHGGLQDH